MSKEDLERIEVDIKTAEENIARYEALQRLKVNRDFKEVIEEGYLKDESVQAVLSKAEPSLQGDEHQKMLDNIIIGIGYFRQYLVKLHQLGVQSKRAIESHRMTREEIMSEED